MPLWLLAAALAAAPAAAREQPAPQAAADESSLTELDRALLKEAKYQLPGGDAVLTPAPESRRLDEMEVLQLLLKLRAKQGRAALTELEAVQDEYLKTGKLTPAQRLKAQIALAKNWDLLPDEARQGFNTLLKEAGAKPVGGLDLAWADKIAKSWDKAVAGTLPDAAAGPSGGTPPLVPATASRPPPAAEVQRRLQRVESATFKDPKDGSLHPYPEDVKRALREVMRHAADEDSAAVLRVLEKRHPLITRSNADMFANADGVAHTPSFDDKGAQAAYRLALPDSYVFAPPPPGKKEPIHVPMAESSFYQDLGLPKPLVDPYLGEAPERVEKTSDGVIEHFADGSIRFKPDPEAQAPVLLHEILHLDTGSEGGGGHALTNEMRSYYAEKRMIYNRDDAAGLTKKKGYADDEDKDWLRKPLQFRAKILGVYMSPQVGEVQSDRVLVAQQLAANERAQATTGADFERLRQAELDRRLKAMTDERKSVIDEMEQNKLITREQAQAGRDHVDQEIREVRDSASFKNWDYRAALQEEHRRLLRDQSTALAIVGQDVGFHRALGIPYAGGVK